MESNCCGASPWFESDICSDCKEHADFHEAWCEMCSEGMTEEEYDFCDICADCRDGEEG